MSSFTALNVVYEDESEDEIDDSKELQIEEALKLYQNALKLHSQGPLFYDEAEAAYKELLSSEIFSYAESLSESRWFELYGDADLIDDIDDEDVAAELPSAITAGEGAPSTLPQVLYLAYKNHGQFRLDRLREQLSAIEDEIRTSDRQDTSDNLKRAASTGLQHLAEALDRDEGDLELWRKVARVSEFLGGQRVARFCLETVLENEEAGPRSIEEPLSLEQELALEQLAPLLALVGDQLVSDRTGRASQRRQHLMKALEKHIDPYPYLPANSSAQLGDLAFSNHPDQEIKVSSRSWVNCGAALLSRLKAEHSRLEGQESVESVFGANYFFSFLSGDAGGVDEALSAEILANGANNQPLNNNVEGDMVNFSHQDKGSHHTKETLILESPTKEDNDITQQAEPSLISPTSDATMKNETVAQSGNIENVEDLSQIDSANAAGIASSNRKRSSDTAELEGAETGRSRSKRIKARGSIADPAALKDTTAEDWTKWYKQQLEIYVKADTAAFEASKGILSSFGCTSAEPPLNREQTASPAQESGPKQSPTQPTDTILQDLKTLLVDWDSSKSKLFLHEDSSQGVTGASSGIPNAGFSAFLTQSADNNGNAAKLPALPMDRGLETFVKDIRRQTWMSLDELVLKWIRQLLDYQTVGSSEAVNTYETFLWPEELKKLVVLLLVNRDEYIYKEITRTVEKISGPSLAAVEPDIQQTDVSQSRKSSVALTQTIFELHLDIYSRITNPSSEVDTVTRTLQRDRLSRWAALASTAMNDPSWPPEEQESETLDAWQLMYRFLWASVMCNSLLESSANRITITYFQHLKEQLKTDAMESTRIPSAIYLPNNAVMPEISIAAAEKEVSRLSTMEFFTSIFTSNDNDPISVIERLEPLLLSSVKREGRSLQGDSEDREPHLNGEENVENLSLERGPDITHDPRLLEALQFLERANLSMKLILWQRLQDAYSVVNYPPQILACNLWSLVTIVRHLESDSYMRSTRETRQENVLRWLHRLDELMTQILALASTNPVAFECVGHDQILSSMEVVASLQNIVHVFGVWEDTIRVGQVQPTPQLSNTASKAQLKSAEKFREMIVKAWTLQYVLVKEATVQMPDVHIADNELMQYMRTAHNMLGLRCYCGLANKMFLKLAKTELLRLQQVDGWNSEMSQVVFDLYGLKISSVPADMQDHSCEPMELDRPTALEMLDLLLLHVNRLSIKDLLKNDLRFAVDKMQGVIRVPKATHGSARTFNKRLMIAYLKSPISPVALYRSIKGIGEMPSTTARTEGHDVAAKGWYFLLGHIALTKFRTQKRITAGSMEDLENAKLFFRQDLEFDTERWETWYRLAQTFDTQIDESTTWTADKLENDKDGLIDLQRMAILCYIMAVAAAKRSESHSTEDLESIANLYADFGIRLYASTREPFNARAFALDDFKRPFNGMTRGMYEEVPFKPVTMYSAWKFASQLLRYAAKQKPHDWYIPYMLSKIYWKLHRYPSEKPPPVNRVDSQLAIDAILHAIKCVPEKRDSRHSDKDPILEPHYKLVSMLHKLVRSESPESVMSVERACHIMKATPYARKVPDVHDSEDWEQYILAVLKAMRSADKSNWHHRMVVRAAHIIYDENPNDMLAILGAKHELSQQIFTKTMTIQVWKPDNERAGRHFVYTGRYVLFFAELLHRTNDRDSMDMLARRIRRKAGDFAHHTAIWTEFSMKYIELLRKSIPVPEHYDETIFGSMSPEEFAADAARLEAWALAPGTECQHIDILRDAMEYKKINNNLMDKGIIESVIAEIYSWIYHRYVDELKAKETAEENRVRMSVDNILTNLTSAPSTIYGPLAEPAGADQQGRGVRRQFSVTRRMIIVKAEALIVKAPAIATPKPVPRALAPAPVPGQSPALAVVIPGPRATSTAEAISVPGSVHDSADDESELSDVEDLVEEPGLPKQQHQTKTPQKPFFPNLLGTKADEDAESTVEEDGGDGTVDADGDGDGDGDDDAENGTVIDDNGNGNGNGNDEDDDDGDGAEEDPEQGLEAEEPPSVQGHVPSGGFGSAKQSEEGVGKGEEVTEQ